MIQDASLYTPSTHQVLFCVITLSVHLKHMGLSTDTHGSEASTCTKAEDDSVPRSLDPFIDVFDNNQELQESCIYTPHTHPVFVLFLHTPAFAVVGGSDSPPAVFKVSPHTWGNCIHPVVSVRKHVKHRLVWAASLVRCDGMGTGFMDASLLYALR